MENLEYDENMFRNFIILMEESETMRLLEKYNDHMAIVHKKSKYTKTIFKFYLEDNEYVWEMEM